MRTLACAVLLAVSACQTPSCDGGGEPFALTTSEGYRLVVLDGENPSAAAFLVDGTSTFVPSRELVGWIERQLPRLLDEAAQDYAQLEPFRLYAATAPAGASPGRGLSYDDLAAELGKQMRGITARLPEYSRQYLGVVQPDGSRRVRVNFAESRTLEDVPDFDSAYHFVFDGGDSFWHIEIDCATHAVVLHSVNGEA